MTKHAYDKRIQRKRQNEKEARRRARRQRQIRAAVSAVAAITIAVVLVIAFVGNNKKTSAKKDNRPTPSASASPKPTGVACRGPNPPAAHPKTYAKYPPTVIKTTKKYRVTMVTSCGTVNMTLNPTLGFKSVNNFVFLARQGFYNGLTFHRIEKNAPFQLVQGGDPKGNGQGGPGYGFVIEKPKKGTRYVQGTVAMANSSTPNSNGSQFFIVVNDVQLPADYTIMGYTDKASQVALNKMVGVPTTGSTPEPKVYIIKVTVKEI